MSSARSVPRVSGKRRQSSPPTTGALPKTAMGMVRWYRPRRRVSGAMIPASRADMEHSPTPVCLGKRGAAGKARRPLGPSTAVGTNQALAGAVGSSEVGGDLT